MAKVREDKHGIYLIAGGYYFRPVFPIGFDHAFKDGTVFKVGDTVKAYHRGGTQLATVKKDDVKETWFSHGATSGKTSVESFKPEYEKWRS